MPPNFTPNDQKALHGLCSDPWANDRQLAETGHMKMTTVTACKRRLTRAHVFKKAYFPAYQRLGYPVLSLSQYL